MFTLWLCCIVVSIPRDVDDIGYAYLFRTKQKLGTSCGGTSVRGDSKRHWLARLYDVRGRANNGLIRHGIASAWRRSSGRRRQWAWRGRCIAHRSRHGRTRPGKTAVGVRQWRSSRLRSRVTIGSATVDVDSKAVRRLRGLGYAMGDTTENGQASQTTRRRSRSNGLVVAVCVVAKSRRRSGGRGRRGLRTRSEHDSGL